MVLMQPVKVCRFDILIGELLAEVNFRAKLTYSTDHWTRNASIPVDQVVGEGKIDVLIDNIENDRYPPGMAGVNQVLESLHTAPPLVGSKVVQGSIPPVKVSLQTHNRHQLQARDAKALEVRQARSDPVK